MTITYKLDTTTNWVFVYQGGDANATMRIKRTVAERQAAYYENNPDYKVVKEGF